MDHLNPIERLASRFVAFWDGMFVDKASNLITQNPELDLFFEKYSPASGQTLYRGLHIAEEYLGEFAKDTQLKNLQIGYRGKLISKNFSSWTTNLRVANDFARSHKEELGLVLKIHATSSQMFLDLNKLSKDYPSWGIRESENEIILYPGVYAFEVTEFWASKVMEDRHYE